MEQGLARRNCGRYEVSQVEEVRARSAREAGKPLQMARNRIAAPETMTMDCEPAERHDEFADRGVRRFRRRWQAWWHRQRRAMSFGQGCSTRGDSRVTSFLFEKRLVFV